MKRLLIVVALLAGAFATVPIASASSCQFVLGFAELAAALPDYVADMSSGTAYPPTMGGCQDSQYSLPNGDAVQHAYGGTFVWRKADNYTAYTDGYRTWITMPIPGIAYTHLARLNSERYPLEADAKAGYSQATLLSCEAPGTWCYTLAFLGPPVRPSPLPPLSPTALCADLTLSYSATHSGTCSSHGGVAVFYR